MISGGKERPNILFNWACHTSGWSAECAADNKENQGTTGIYLPRCCRTNRHISSIAAMKDVDQGKCTIPSKTVISSAMSARVGHV